MADGVTVDNAGLAPYDVSTDEGASGKHVQRVKLTFSDNGEETHVHADADGLRVNLGANNDVTISGTVTVQEDSPIAVTDNGASFTVDTDAGPLDVNATFIPATTGGLDIFRSLDLDETEEAVKASAGQVYGWFIANLSADTRFIKFYNATTANVSVGTTAPVITIPLPGNADQAIAANAFGDTGIEFDTAITVAATTGLADNDTGAPDANDVVVNIFYK